jgi:hypothetical protein
VSFAQPGWSSEESSRHSGAQAETSYSVRWGITGTASSLMSGRIRDVGLCVLGPRMFVLRIVGRFGHTGQTHQRSYQRNPDNTFTRIAAENRQCRQEARPDANSTVATPRPITESAKRAAPRPHHERDRTPETVKPC